MEAGAAFCTSCSVLRDDFSFSRNSNNLRRSFTGDGAVTDVQQAGGGSIYLCTAQLSKISASKFFSKLPVKLKHDGRRRRFSVQASSSNNQSQLSGNEDKVQELFQGFVEAEQKKFLQEESRLRLKRVQVERKEMEKARWSKTFMKLTGQLKGSPWDPIEAETIPYSQFRELLKAQQVQFLEYADLGQTVGVILPYQRTHRQEVVQGEPIDEAEPPTRFAIKEDEGEIVWRRHRVAQMPADAWADVWKQLHGQVASVEVRRTDTLLAHAVPPLETTLVWGLRVAAAFAVWQFIDSRLRPVFRRFLESDLPPRRKMKKVSELDDALGSLAQSRARLITSEDSTGVTFDDFAGQEYVKRELQEIVKLLKNDQEYASLGVYCPKGVMLYGPPGTGKTLLARAVAGEAGVPFFSVSGAEFVEMFAGVAAARVRDLFSRARAFAPSIIFIDEIDSIGAKRGKAGGDDGAAEREQALVQMLTELDGFEVISDNVVVIGATNRLDILDPALLRKGRFDRTVRVGLPEEDGRYDILQVHARNKNFRSEEERDALFREVAALTEDFSGADLANVLNEAAILAVREDKDYIEQPELLKAIERAQGQYQTGQEDRIQPTEETRLRIAYREAAVAVLECYYPDAFDIMTKTSMKRMDPIPNVEYEEAPHRVFAKKDDMIGPMIKACAAREIEMIIFGEENLSWMSGAALGEAGIKAEYIILQTGQTALGPLTYQTENDLVPNIRPKVVALRDEYVRFARETCRAVLLEYRSAIETITSLLLDKGEGSAEEIKDIFNKSPLLPKPYVRPIDEYGPLIYAGRFGVNGLSLAGRAMFHPTNCGFVSFAAPVPQEVKRVEPAVWEMLDKAAKDTVEEYARMTEEKKVAPPQELVVMEHFV